MLFFLIFLPITGIAQIYNTEVAAEIELDNSSEFIQVSGSAYNKTRINRSLSYVLSVIKTDPGGNVSKNDQSGRFVLQAGEKKKLSITTVDFDDKTKVIILLLVYDLDEKLLGKDRIVLNEDSKDKKIVLKPRENSDVRTEFAKSDGVELRGIVLEETKTKPGRDFYTEYYSKYMYYSVNGPKIVTIKEELAIANNTMLQVKIDDEIIMEFIVRPQNDFIKGMADIAVRRTMAYFQNLEKQKDIIKQYK
jgi:hypothetical protein